MPLCHGRNSKENIFLGNYAGVAWKVKPFKTGNKDGIIAQLYFNRKFGYASLAVNYYHT